MRIGVDPELEAAADEFLRSHGEEPPRLRPWSEELAVARRARLRASRSDWHKTKDRKAYG